MQKRDWAGGQQILGIISKEIVTETRGVDEIVWDECAD